MDKLICPGCGEHITSEHPGFSKYSPETLLCEPCLKNEDWKKEDWLETEASALMVEALEDRYNEMRIACKGMNAELMKKANRLREIARLMREADADEKKHEAESKE